MASRLLDGPVDLSRKGRDEYSQHGHEGNDLDVVRVRDTQHDGANTIVAEVTILAVATGGHGLYYIFFAAVEILSMPLIAWLAWKRLTPSQ